MILDLEPYEISLGQPGKVYRTGPDWVHQCRQNGGLLTMIPCRLATDNGLEFFSVSKTRLTNGMLGRTECKDFSVEYNHQIFSEGLGEFSLLTVDIWEAIIQTVVPADPAQQLKWIRSQVRYVANSNGLRMSALFGEPDSLGFVQIVGNTRDALLTREGSIGFFGVAFNEGVAYNDALLYLFTEKSPRAPASMRLLWRGLPP